MQAMQKRKMCSNGALRQVATRPCRIVVRPMAISTGMQRFGGVGPSSSDAGFGSKVAIFVEPSPFSHVSGMKNRFESLIKGLRDEGDEVVVVTPDKNPPKEYCGAKVMDVFGFPLPFYSTPTLLLSTGISIRVFSYLWKLRPDVIHVSTPGIMFIAAFIYAKLLGIPIVLSYHTHITEYIPKYTWAGLVVPAWSILRWGVRNADLTLVTSKAMKDELSAGNCRNKSIEIWQRGVDTEVFNPKFRCADMRSEMTDGNVDKPLLVYVGRLGKEKNISAMKTILDQLPGCRLALVGDGPQRKDLEVELKDYPVKFMGMMRGERLSKAYASADIFIMPSETETLGFVVLEAMAAGLPVVSVSAGGLTDIIGDQDGVTGFLYPVGDYVKAAQLIKSLVEDKELAARVGAAARADMERFGWSAATKVLREHQYTKAKKRKSGKLRFRLMALRVSIAQLFRAIWTSLVWFVRPLDYARHLRASAV